MSVCDTEGREVLSSRNRSAGAVRRSLEPCSGGRDRPLRSRPLADTPFGLRRGDRVAGRDPALSPTLAQPARAVRGRLAAIPGRNRRRLDGGTVSPPRPVRLTARDGSRARRVRQRKGGGCPGGARSPADALRSWPSTSAIPPALLESSSSATSAAPSPVRTRTGEASQGGSRRNDLSTRSAISLTLQSKAPRSAGREIRRVGENRSRAIGARGFRDLPFAFEAVSAASFAKIFTTGSTAAVITLPPSRPGSRFTLRATSWLASRNTDGATFSSPRPRRLSLRTAGPATSASVERDRAGGRARRSGRRRGARPASRASPPRAARGGAGGVPLPRRRPSARADPRGARAHRRQPNTGGPRPGLSRQRCSSHP